MYRGFVFVVAFSLIAVTAAAQGRGGGRGGGQGAGAAEAQRVIELPLPLLTSSPRFVQPKTPCGDPDLQGSRAVVELVVVPMQRPARFWTRYFLAYEQFAPRARDLQ